jgi:flagellar biosynthetic protein FlhB
MTKQEIKEELKTTMGNPELKQRQRGFARKIMNQRLHQNVPKADVVVTNPEHIAIAIKWDPDKMNAPIVLAKGADYVALRIRQIAMANGIPIIEKKPLARAMYPIVQVGREIPPMFFQAVAEVLAFVFRLNGKFNAA